MDKAFAEYLSSLNNSCTDAASPSGSSLPFSESIPPSEPDQVSSSSYIIPPPKPDQVSSFPPIIPPPELNQEPSSPHTIPPPSSATLEENVQFFYTRAECTKYTHTHTDIHTHTYLI